MTIGSTAFEEGESIPEIYSADGNNVNPPLIIEDVPEEAVSLALIVEDPDAPSGTFTHWLVWNIDPKTTEIPEDSTPPESVEGFNDAGEPGYMGPKPPSGTHRYFFKLYALDKMLDLDNSAIKEDLENQIQSSLIENCELIGTYSKKE